MRIPSELYSRYKVHRGAVDRNLNTLIEAMRERYDELDAGIGRLIDQAGGDERAVDGAERRELDELRTERRRVEIDLSTVELQLELVNVGTSGGSIAFRDSTGRELRGYRPGERIAPPPTEGDITPGAFLAAAVRSSLGQRLAPHEQRALEGATGSAGGFFVDEALSARFIDLIRAGSALSRAGAITVPLSGAADQFHLARIDADPVPTWRPENAPVNEDDPIFSRVSFVPATLAVMVKIPVELVQDAANIVPAAETSLSGAVGGEIDRAGLFGSGTGDEPLGVTGTSGVTVIAHNATLTGYSPFVQALRALEDANIDSSQPSVAALMSPRDWETLQLLEDSTGQPLRPPPSVEQLRQLRTTRIPTDGGAGSNESELLLADWSRVLIGMRQEVQVEILREAFRSNLQVGVLVWTRVDFVLERPEALVRVTGVQG
ncbi:phage major capsid protein [Thioalkalivibrio sp.]|uniref:phage major capsid protein n=1 Tax=Thioalkalivibrio sp. TaxID=2093813 RepID=UPI00356B112D